MIQLNQLNQLTQLNQSARLLIAASSALLAAGLTSPSIAAILSTLQAGTGASQSTIQIDFSNGNGYLLQFRYDNATSGFAALEALDAALPEFTLVYESTVFGPLVVGLGVLDDYEFGTGDLWPRVENYWHYWVNDSGSWDFATMGAADRLLFDGSFDAWVFGSSAQPQPVPSAMPAAVLIGLVCLRRRRCCGRA